MSVVTPSASNASEHRQSAAKASSEFVVVAVRDEALPSIATGEGKAGGASPSAKKGARKGEEEKEAVSFEAYQISNQAFGWFEDGTLADDVSKHLLVQFRLGLEARGLPRPAPVPFERSYPRF